MVSISLNSSFEENLTRLITGVFLITAFPPVSPSNFNSSTFLSSGKNTGENLSSSTVGIVIRLVFWNS